MAIYKPKWFSDHHVMVSTAPTCGLTRGGRLLRKVDPLTAKRIQELDQETAAPIDSVDDQLLRDMEALVALNGLPTDRSILPDTLSFIPSDLVRLSCAVPVYYDRQYEYHFTAALKQDPIFANFGSATLGPLVGDKRIMIRGGHGSPSQEQRIGEVPYIKVSDLRAGLVNINPTNRVPRSIAEQFWKGQTSGLRAFDLICPERTSKNIGDFCVLMPGQEQVLTTKEVIILRPGLKANLDTFYLLWVMSLNIVSEQWRRVVFKQTNREDVGERYLELLIPIPPSKDRADEVSAAFREYYETIAKARNKLQYYLNLTKAHHSFVSGVEEPEPGLVADNGLT
jgi:type I restriction enzyme M protein